jgi:hypothetical protein
MTQDASLRLEGHKIFVSTADMQVDLVGLGLSRVHNRQTRRDYLNVKPALHLIVTDNSGGESRNGLLSEANLQSVRQTSPGEVQVRYQTLSAGLPGARVSGTIRLKNQSRSLEASVQLEKPGLAAVIHALWGLENRHELLVPMLGACASCATALHCECSHPLKSGKVRAPLQGDT